MKLHCPHCRNPITLADAETKADVVCPACGSTFPLADLDTTGWTPAQSYGKFEVLEVVGHGAFGTVYKARDPELDRVVAIKVPRAGNLAGPEELRRFVREARSVAQLRHPSIVSIHEVGNSANVPFLVSDFIDGVTLADWLSASRPTFAQAAKFVAQLADALQYAHEQGVVHRDIKPSNIMLERVKRGEAADEDESSHKPTAPAYRLRIMDFGLAKRDAGEVSMTVDGQVLGTPAYMSPEQAKGEAHTVDGRTDIYSLGVVLYQLLTGELPFRGTPRMLLHQVQNDEPRRPRSLNDHIPRDLETICLKALAKEPSRRYATAKDFGDDLRRYQKGQPILARPVGPMERAWRWSRRRPAVAGLLTLLLVVLAIGLPTLTGLWLQANAARRKIEEDRNVVAKAKDDAETERDIARKATEAANEGRAAARGHLYSTRASLIQVAWRERALGRVQELLELQKPKDDEADLRGFEWHYFSRLLDGSQITLTGHADAVTAVAFSPNRRHLASGSADGVVKIWELSTRLELASFPSPGGSVAGVALSTDARRLAAVSLDGTVRVWNTATGKEIYSLAKRTIGLGSLSFSPDGRQLAVAGPAKATLHDDASKEILAFEGHGKSVTALSFSRDGKRVTSAGADGSARVWDAASGKQMHLLTGLPPVVQVNFMADDRTVLLTSMNGGLAYWQPETGKTNVIPMRGPTAMSPDGRQLAYLGDAAQESARVVDPASGRETFALRKHAGPITRMVFSADGARIATASQDRTIKVWSAGIFELDVLELSGHVGEVFAVVFSPDGKELVTGGADGQVRVREAATGQTNNLLKAHSPVRRPLKAPDQTHHLQGVSALAYSKDGKRLVSGGADGAVAIWDPTTGKKLHGFRAHGNAVSGVAFNSDGRLLASSSWDRTVKLWDAASGKLQHTLTGHQLAATRVAFSPDGAMLASSSWDQTIRFWDPATGAPLRAIQWTSPPGRVDPLDSLSFHPDGKYLAAAPDRYGGEGDVKVFNLDTGAAVHSLGGHIYGIFQVVFSRDGRRLASCSCDGGLKVWDMATGQELLSYHNHTGLPPGAEGPINSRLDALHSVALSPDGQRLALGCRNSKVLVLDASPATTEQLVGREASRLVQSLYDQLVTKSAVLEHLAGDAGMSPAMRAEIRTRAERYLQDAKALNDRSWKVVVQPKAPEEAYRRALLEAEEACRLAPDSRELVNTLGVAQYRAGKYQAALDSLLASDKANAAGAAGSDPADLAFLAMAYHRTGNKWKAQVTLGRLRQAMQHERWAKNAEARAFLQEAEALVPAANADELKKKGP